MTSTTPAIPPQKDYDIEVSVLECALKEQGWRKEPDYSGLGISAMWAFPVEGSRKTRSRLITIGYLVGGGLDIQEMDQGGPWAKYLIPLTDPVWSSILPFIAQFIANTVPLERGES